MLFEQGRHKWADDPTRAMTLIRLFPLNEQNRIREFQKRGRGSLGSGDCLDIPSHNQ